MLEFSLTSRILNLAAHFLAKLCFASSQELDRISVVIVRVGQLIVGVLFCWIWSWSRAAVFVVLALWC